MTKEEINGFVFRMLAGVPKKRFPDAHTFGNGGRLYHKVLAYYGDIVVP